MRSEPRQRVVTGTDQTAGRSWHSCIWGELATLEYGKALRGYRSAEGQYPVFGTNGPIGWHTDMLDAGPSVIVGRKGTLGVQYTQGPFFVIDTAFYLKQRVQFDVRWAYYELLSHDINGLDSGSAIPSTTREAFYSLPVRVPPLAEQRAIAHILGTLDDKIEVNRRMNATLDDIARALFTSWFVHFDPVRAKAALTQRASPGGSAWLVARAYLDRLEPALAALFPDRFVDSELGPIPAGWAIGPLADIAVSPRRGVDPTELPDDTPYIGLEHMPRQSVALTEWGNAGEVTSHKTLFKKDDILFGKLRPYFHKVGLAPVDGVCSTDIVVLAPQSAEWAAFVLACVSSSEFVSYTARTSTGTRMPRTSWPMMGAYRICRPAAPVAHAFQTVMRPLLERLVANIHASHALAALRDTLLPKLLSGQIRVRDAAAQTS